MSIWPAFPPVFIYGLVDPRTGHICYVGRSIDPQARLTEHLTDPEPRSLAAWIANLCAHGLIPTLVILGSHATVHGAHLLETRLIHGLQQQGAPLLNQSYRQSDDTYDTARYYLGRLCKRAHNWQSTGRSLRRHSDMHCLDCHRAKARKSKRSLEQMGDAMVEQADLVLKIHARVVNNVHGCWLWTGGRWQGGYGMMQVRRVRWRVHRLLWTLTVGPIPPGMILCHVCDVHYAVNDITYRRCVNPNHLVVARDADNFAHAQATGRRVYGPRPDLMGERNVTAKINAQQVNNIRVLFATGAYSKARLARMFGVSESLVRAIVNRTLWAHLPLPDRKSTDVSLKEHVL